MRSEIRFELYNRIDIITMYSIQNCMQQPYRYKHMFLMVNLNYSSLSQKPNVNVLIV